MVIALGEETDRGLEIDPVVVTDLGLEVEIGPVVDRDLVQGQDRDLVQGQDRNQAQEAVAEIDPAQEQDQARARVQGLDQVRDKDRVRATGVPLVAREGVEVLHPETVNEVHPVVLANQAQEVHRAEVVVDVAAPVVVVVDAVVAVAEVAVADVDVDLKWQLKTPKQPHRTIE